MTQTLAKISDVNHCNIEFLDPQERDTLIRDLEHLMLAEFPANELRPDTRVSFAAARIGRIAAQRELSVKEIVDLRRRIVQLESVTGIERSATRDKLLETRRGYQRSLFERHRAERKFRRHILGLLLKAVAEFPEKIRLWQYVLQFSLRTGENDLPGLLSQLRNFQRKNGVAAKYVEASVLQFLARQAILASQTICSADALPDSRRAASKYLRAIISNTVISSFLQDGPYYLDCSRHLYFAACGLAAAYIAECSPEAETPAKWLTLI